jgi:hypothetical protein
MYFIRLPKLLDNLMCERTYLCLVGYAASCNFSVRIARKLLTMDRQCSVSLREAGLSG